MGDEQVVARDDRKLQYVVKEVYFNYFKSIAVSQTEIQHSSPINKY
jgi:hypothetical protein